jgi:hypothetical protein
MFSGVQFLNTSWFGKSVTQFDLHKLNNSFLIFVVLLAFVSYSSSSVIESALNLFWFQI